MTKTSFFLCFFVATTATSALLTWAFNNIFHAALSLAACMLSIAALFGLLGAEFIAITQLLIYVASVVMLILFGIMITSYRPKKKGLYADRHYMVPGVLIAAALFGLFIYCQPTFSEVPPVVTSDQAIKSIGATLFSEYILPFEWCGLILLIILIGACYTAAPSLSKKS